MLTTDGSIEMVGIDSAKNHRCAEGVISQEQRCCVNRERFVACGNNVGLHSVVCCVGGVPLSHDTFVKGSHGRATVITSDTEDDCSLLLHWCIARSAPTIPVRRKRTCLCIGT